MKLKVSIINLNSRKTNSKEYHVVADINGLKTGSSIVHCFSD